MLSTAIDFTRRKADLIAENALLRQQLIVLHRQVKKPSFSPSDRLGLVLLASGVKNWKESLLIFKPATLLRCHRQGFRLFWKFKSRHRSGRPKSDTETVSRWHKRIGCGKPNARQRRGELLKLGFSVVKHTIQKYIARVRPAKLAAQSWAIFLNHHAKHIWACDFLPVINLWVHPLYLFVIFELASRRMVHLGVTRSPTDVWVAQPLPQATPFGHAPRFLIRDRDRKYGEAFTPVAVRTSIEVLQTPCRAPNANRVCERFLGSMRRKCLDPILVLGEQHVYRVMRKYVEYSHRARPHQGIEQQIPEGCRLVPEKQGKAKIIAFPILNGLLHDYRMAACARISHFNGHG